MFLQHTLKSRWRITSSSFLFLKTLQYAANFVLCSIIDKTKLLTWSVQAAIASKNPRKPWQKNCTVLLDHCDTAHTVTLLVLQYSQVKDSQNTGTGRKELVCTQEKCHFTKIKPQCLQCTVMKMEPYVLRMQNLCTELTIPGTSELL